MENKIDENFIPFLSGYNDFLKTAKTDFRFNIGTDKGSFLFRTKTAPDVEKSVFYTERLIKAALFIAGGFRLYLCGDERVTEELKRIFSSTGRRKADVALLEHVYGRPFQVIVTDKKHIPRTVYNVTRIKNPVGQGGVIGLDVGGSDYKIVSKYRGKIVFSQEKAWYPKLNSNPEYHFSEISSAIRLASSYLPTLNSIGISSAGIIIDNDIKYAALFRKVPESRHSEICGFYGKILREYNVPYKVVNDGEVAALSGAKEIRRGRVLGIAMGTSTAGGYVDRFGNFNGFLGELSFLPLDIGADAPEDWLNDTGTAGRYLSQDAVIRLAEKIGITFPDISLAEKLKLVQNLPLYKTRSIFEQIGIYLAYAVATYRLFYDIGHVSLMGRVMSGEGGDIILATAKKKLRELLPHCRIRLHLSGEKQRRLGQAETATFLI